MQNYTSPITTRRYFITGAQRLSNVFWASLILFGGAGFLLTGFFSFVNRFTPSYELHTNLSFVETLAEQGFAFLRFKDLGGVQSPALFATCPVAPYPTPLLCVRAPHPVGVKGQPKGVTEGARVAPLGARVKGYGEGNGSSLLLLREPSRADMELESLRACASNFFIGGGDALNLFYRDRALKPIFYTEVAQIEANAPLVTSSIRFFPQGLIMCFYGSLGLIFSFYLWSTIFWKVGDGFNEFNKETGVVRIFRWGLPGKNRQISFVYPLKDIEALRILDKEGLNPRRTIALQIKGKGEIPLTRIGEPIPLQEIENQASSLAAFLKVEIEVLSR